MSYDWNDFWMKYSNDLSSIDLQSQVLRTRNQKPITKELWEKTLAYLHLDFSVTKEDVLLDLCCGNGLITKSFSPRVSSIAAVDIGQGLLDELDKQRLNNVKTICGDMRYLKFEKNSFSKIIWYAAIQYLTQKEIISLFYNINSWLCKGGELFIGDIPDYDKMWGYFNTKERKTAYFKSISDDRPIIGSWIDKNWLVSICESLDFEIKILEQRSELIYSDFRYDCLITKR
jgi:ubiquinone/menaquinone biosynthesis C-methylase UbiE